MGNGGALGCGLDIHVLQYRVVVGRVSMVGFRRGLVSSGGGWSSPCCMGVG